MKDKTIVNELRNLFIKRMTVDSDHHDRRRKDFNQAIFGFSDDKNKIPEKTYQIWCEMDMAMVLQCFDDAIKDWESKIHLLQFSKTKHGK